MQPTSTRRRIVASAVAAATALGILAAAPVPDAGAQAVGQLRTGENYRQGADTSASRGRDVPGLAIDPADPNHVVSVDVDGINGECSFKTSYDGGLTWPFGGNFDATPSTPGTAPDVNKWPDPLCYQNFDSGGYAHGNTSVVFGTGGNVYTSFSAHRGPYQRPESGLVFGRGDDSLVARSTDGGKTFLPAVAAIEGDLTSMPYFIRPQVAVHRGRGTNGQDRVYLAAWACRIPQPPTSGCSGGNDVRQMWVTRSDDSGQTWGPRVMASDPVGGTALGPSQVNEPSHPLIDPRNGNLYLAYRRRDNAGANTFPFRSEVEVARSTDLGATWTRSTVAPVKIFPSTTGGNPAPQLAHPRAAIDPINGNLYVAWQDATGANANDPDIWLSRSTDAGATWSVQKRVNDDPPGAAPLLPSQRVPRVEVAPNGRVDVAWLDRRHDPVAVNASRGLSDIYYSYSTDGGLTFSANRRITDRHLNLDVGLTGVGGYTWYGPVMAPIGNDKVLFAWTDSREGNYNNGTQDIYLARMDVQGGGPAVKRLPETPPPSLSVTLGRLAYPGGLEAIGSNPLPISRPVVVNETDAASALVAAPLARAFLAPLLASPQARLTNDQRSEVARMEAVGAFVVGGEPALGPGVVTALGEANVPADQITRLAGTSPADTARLVAQAMDPRTPAQKQANAPAAFPLAVVVNPASSEALAAAGLAASLKVPILFADQSSVPAATTQALASLAVTSTLVIGNGSVLSDSVLASLPGSRRIGGADLKAVSQAVATEAATRRMPVNIGYVADPQQPVVAAMAAAVAARNGGLLLLSPGADATQADGIVSAAGLQNTLDRLVVVKSGAGGPGYRLVATDGGVFAFGSAGFFGSTGAMRLTRPIVSMANTPSNNGYWMAGADGGVFAFGDASFYGSTGSIRLAQAVVGIAPTPSGKGYWLVAKDGGVFAFGDAKFLGSTGSRRLNQPIVSLVPSPSGNGYWLIAADGGVFAFGDAGFLGSTGATRLNQPIVAGAPSSSGAGYWLVASDGGVFAFGDAGFLGSTGAMKLAKPVVDVDATTSGRGYFLTASDGGVFAFGDAQYAGSTGGMRINAPVVGIAASPTK